jgi:hypothetical protein
VILEADGLLANHRLYFHLSPTTRAEEAAAWFIAYSLICFETKISLPPLTSQQCSLLSVSLCPSRLKHNASAPTGRIIFVPHSDFGHPLSARCEARSTIEYSQTIFGRRPSECVKQRRWFPRMLQSSSGVSVFAPAPHPQAQPTLVPKLALHTETMRCLNESDQKGHADRAQPGNLLEELTGRMLLAFTRAALSCILSVGARHPVCNRRGRRRTVHHVGDGPVRPHDIKQSATDFARKRIRK